MVSKEQDEVLPRIISSTKSKRIEEIFKGIYSNTKKQNTVILMICLWYSENKE